jgi:hypothetical protein
LRSIALDFSSGDARGILRRDGRGHAREGGSVEDCDE